MKLIYGARNLRVELYHRHPYRHRLHAIVPKDHHQRHWSCFPLLHLLNFQHLHLPSSPPVDSTKLLVKIAFGWMPEALVAGDLSSGRLALVPYQPGSRRVFTPKLVQRTDRVPGRAAQALVALVQQFWPSAPTAA